MWNHGLLKYRDRDIPRALLLKLCDELDGKFTEEDIKKEWNSLLTRYRKERQAEKTSRSSGAGVDDVFNSSWEHFERITFFETTPETDPVMSTLGKSAETTPPAPKKPSLLRKVKLELRCISLSQRALKNLHHHHQVALN